MRNIFIYGIITAGESNILSTIMVVMGHDSIWDILIGFITIFDDLFINLDSQLAVGYTGAVEYKRKFTVSDYDFSQRATSDPPIPHNLEPCDAQIHAYILSKIHLGRYIPNGGGGGEGGGGGGWGGGSPIEESVLNSVPTPALTLE